MQADRVSKRIAHVNLARSYRGGERQTELLVRGLLETEFVPIVVARAGGELAHRLADAGVEIRQDHPTDTL